MKKITLFILVLVLLFVAPISLSAYDYVRPYPDDPLNVQTATGDTITVETASGTPIAVTTETGDSLDVFIQDQHSEIVDLHMTQQIQDLTVITAVAIDDMLITVSGAAEPINGHLIGMKEDSAFGQYLIVSHAANAANWDITVDAPFDFAYTTAAIAKEKNINLAVNGSVTPVNFTISPVTTGEEWDITRIIFIMTAVTVMDDSKFGGITALTNGIVLRAENSRPKNIFTAVSNSELMVHMYDIDYSDKAPAGVYGLRGRRSFAGADKNGVTIRLSGAGKLVMIVQDDLTGLETFYLVAQGHVVVN